MDSVLNKSLARFPGGLQLPGHKQASTTCAVEFAGLPPYLVLPLQQHIGEASEPIVRTGDHVLKGEVVARANGYVSVPLHAPTSGRVVAIEARPVPHPSGLSAPCIVVEPDGKDTWAEHLAMDNYRSADPSALRNRIREAGIVGLGGAGFPSFIKLNPGPRTQLKTLVINGAECEPYITCDDMLMRERAEEIIQGAVIVAHVLSAAATIIGIEDNKPEAAAALRTAASGTDIAVVEVPTIYPTGGERQLIQVLTGLEVPSNGLPLDIGVVCHNVATLAAVYRAIVRGEPLLSRYVTVTGSGVKEPRNLEALLGTPMAYLIEHCGGDAASLHSLVMGGPMMGFTIHDPDVPVIKTTNCLLTTHRRAARPTPPAMPCIRCGRCAEVCPARLLPQQLYWFAQARNFDKVQDYNLFDCIECGCCAYVCPSNIPLVQYYRFAKTEIWQQERDKEKSDRSRQRHEFRLERLEREKRERSERHRKRREAQADDTGRDAAAAAKKAAIAAALERVKARKTQSGVEPRNVDNLTAEQQRLIDEAERRRASTKQAQDKD